MTLSIKAVYENGYLRLLQPLDLPEGQVVQVSILTARERLREALGDLLVDKDLPEDDDFDEEAIMREIDEAFQGQPPLSEDIIQERREGP
jgi:predicted DNA-binding antitoxin AbrB/MazE fold protein